MPLQDVVVADHTHGARAVVKGRHYEVAAVRQRLRAHNVDAVLCETRGVTREPHFEAPGFLGVFAPLQRQITCP